MTRNGIASVLVVETMESSVTDLIVAFRISKNCRVGQVASISATATIHGGQQRGT